jgi:hypothetical protein
MEEHLPTIMLIALYLLPALIAALRRHRNQNAIAVLNLFFGWTLIGWFAALFWSFTNPDRNPYRGVGNYHGEPQITQHGKEIQNG